MATSKYIALMFLAVTCLSAVSWAGNVNFEEAVRVECGFTRYPTLCVKTLTPASVDPNGDFLSTLVSKTISETKMPDSYVGSLTSNSLSLDSQLIQTATDYCEELMEMSVKRLNQALELLKKSPKKNKDDIQTWLSAALTFQEACRDTIKDHVASNAYMAQIYSKMDHLSQLGSNSLALANRITGSPTPTGRKLLERAVFPSWVSAADRKLLQTTGVKANAVVAKDGSGDFETVAEAINAATGGRFVIYVKSGTYNEKISTNKDGITLIGDGKYSTIITAGSSVGKGASLGGSATFTVHGDGFIARDIGFQNTAGPDGHQAIALAVSSDRSVIYRCSISGYQDTLYALSLRQFYRECDIYGTIDYIFGNAVAVLQSCNLIFRRPRSGASFNAILANGRTDPGQNTGFSVQNCKITVGSDFSTGKNSFSMYLGRPWKAYSRAVVMQSNIDGAISPRGWNEWEGAGGSTYKTLYFAEYGNMGAGAATSGRVNWPGYHVIGTPEASKFTVGNFIAGNSWLPSTGVSFVSGL
ncbi:Plant invertase/pectin methylesterase inhibitor superfamily [Perilla frutescens var. hirtella]|uniref:Pectinesterase n=1 Tax=Perilla frutescens var. hirtella TaxID=608512 RepID=A0AAD4IUF4_PERFH|nr:Plant invertase/pectin methylesterase inhibitor superfamily [Perilla frutescens var. hirtella]